jgi:hypothetical protein
VFAALNPSVISAQAGIQGSVGSNGRFPEQGRSDIFLYQRQGNGKVLLDSQDNRMNINGM